MYSLSKNNVIAIGVLMAVSSISLFAQSTRQSLDEGWSFVRLDDKSAVTWTAGQQGTDWSSQFNVQHAGNAGAYNTLALSDSLIATEKTVISNAKWENVRLPHTAYVEPLVIQHPWQGVCYYRRNIDIDSKQLNGQIWIEFEGAMQLADIWINGSHAMQHPGGFNSFVVDATSFVHEGENELLVRLDNRDNGLIPPGKPLNVLDFCYHSGLYRDVNLICKPSVSITHPLLSGTVAGGGIFVTYPEVTSECAVVKVKTEIENKTEEPKSLSVRQTLFEWSKKKGIGREVASTSSPINLGNHSRSNFTQQLQVNKPRLWSPDSPNLYMLRTEVLDGKSIVDSEDTRIGIRHFDITNEGCFINGKRVELDGANRHQEYPYLGNAISDHAQYRDMWQMKTCGFNTVRLGHYPQDPSILDACDELGLLAIEPIPGWQFFNKDPLFISLTYSDVQQMIRRDRNHPCILMWETTLNESWPPAEWKDGAVATAHAEMPDGQCYTSGDSYGYSGFDVCYNDWDEESFSRPNKSGKPAFIREFYDYEFGGHYSTTRVSLGDGERAQRQNLWNLQWSLNSNRTTSNNTIGGAVWSMYDYNRGCCDNICYSGLADLFRRPKYGLHLFRTQIPYGSNTPCGKMPYEMFLATRWDAESSDTVIVLGNVDEVALVINGKEVARKKADKGPKTAYSPLTNGGNSDRLAYPPFTFMNIPFEAGQISAIGYDVKGKKVAECKLQTPDKPARLSIAYFEGGVKAQKNDVIIVYASLTDSHGSACHNNGIPVTLEVTGGKIAGPSTVETEDGIASFVVLTDDATELQLSAKSQTLKAFRKFKL